jgi:hypothetical protein
MVFRNACTVQPKAWPAGGPVTVAGSELIRIPSPSRNAPNEDAHSAGGPGWYLALSGGGGPGYHMRRGVVGSAASPVSGSPGGRQAATAALF